jgi:hypothetical protein
MIRRLIPLLLLAGLAACNRHGVADVTLDADAAQRNATSAKTLADLAAADAASQGRPPIVRDRPVAAEEGVAPARAAPSATATGNETAMPADDTADVDTNG